MGGVRGAVKIAEFAMGTIKEMPTAAMRTLQTDPQPGLGQGRTGHQLPPEDHGNGPDQEFAVGTGGSAAGFHQQEEFTYPGKA